MTKHARIASLLRELAQAFEALDEPERKRPRPTKPAALPEHEPSTQAIETARRALRKKGIAA